MDSPFIGTVSMFAGNFAPKGWVLCNGQLLTIAQNTALFSILGVTYGGDGKVNFAVPDLRGRAPLHFGQGTAGGATYHPLGEKLGVENIALTSLQLPAHSHVMYGSTAVGDANDPQGGLFGVSTDANALGNPLNYIASQTDMATSTTLLQPTGSSQPHNNMQPSLPITFIMATVGIFPSRG